MCPAKYRKNIFVDEIETYLVKVCKGEIEQNYEIRFDEIGIDGNHVHFLIQGVPMLSPTQIIRKVKSITAIRVHEKFKEKIERLGLYRSRFWSRGYYVNTVGRYGGYDTIKNYVKNQGRKYKIVYQNPNQSESLFAGMLF